MTYGYSFRFPCGLSCTCACLSLARREAARSWKPKRWLEEPSQLAAILIDAKVPALAEADDAAEAKRLAFRLSGSLCCGVSRERRQFLGRWRVSSSGHEYVRTARKNVTHLQLEVVNGVLANSADGVRDIGLCVLESYL